MSWDYAVGSVLGVVLLLYLTYALLNPEKF